MTRDGCNAVHHDHHGVFGSLSSTDIISLTLLALGLSHDSELNAQESTYMGLISGHVHINHGDPQFIMELLALLAFPAALC